MKKMAHSHILLVGFGGLGVEIGLHLFTAIYIYIRHCHIPVYTYTPVYTCIYLHTPVYTCIHLYTSAYTCIYLYTYTCIYL